VHLCISSRPIALCCSRGLPTCSSSTSSPAVTRHQQEMQRFHAVVKGAHAPQKQGLMLLNPGELSGELKDPDGESCLLSC